MAAGVVDNGSGTCNTEFAGDDAPRVELPSIIDALHVSALYSVCCHEGERKERRERRKRREGEREKRKEKREKREERREREEREERRERRKREKKEEDRTEAC